MCAEVSTAAERADVPLGLHRGVTLKQGWLLLGDYRATVASLAFTPPNDFTPEQRSLLLLMISVVTAELNKEYPAGVPSGLPIRPE